MRIIKIMAIASCTLVLNGAVAAQESVWGGSDQQQQSTGKTLHDGAIQGVNTISTTEDQLSSGAPMMTPNIDVGGIAQTGQDAVTQTGSFINNLR